MHIVKLSAAYLHFTLKRDNFFNVLKCLEYKNKRFPEKLFDFQLHHEKFWASFIWKIYRFSTLTLADADVLNLQIIHFFLTFFFQTVLRF